MAIIVQKFGGSSVADVEKLFGEVLDFILDHGVRYRLKRE